MATVWAAEEIVTTDFVGIWYQGKQSIHVFRVNDGFLFPRECREIKDPDAPPSFPLTDLTLCAIFYGQMSAGFVCFDTWYPQIERG